MHAPQHVFAFCELTPPFAASHLAPNADGARRPLLPQEDVKVEYYLWQLYHIDQEAKRKRAEMAEQQAEVARLQDADAAVEAKVPLLRASRATCKNCRKQGCF